MTNLKRLLTRPLRPLPISIVAFLLAIALVGFADAVYLTFEHYQGIIPPCSLTGGCELVLTSRYSTIFGIPVSLLGVIYYLAILVGIFSYLEGHNEKLLRYSLFLTVFGFLASLWFVFLQMFVIHSFCAYCLGSALTSTILFVTAVYIFKKYSGDRTDQGYYHIQ